MSDKLKRYTIEDHLCRKCGGRILKCLDSGYTGGGNPVFRCADCGAQSCGMSSSGICWCGFRHRGYGQETEPPFLCLPFRIIKDMSPSEEIKREWVKAFRSCGCEPEKGEVGMMTNADFRNIARM